MMATNIDTRKNLVIKALNKKTYYENELGATITANGDGWSKNLRCPFHDDHNPSFGVNIETGAFRCFSCDAKGDLFNFHMRRHGLSFPDALSDLARLAGIEAPTENRSRDRPEPQQRAKIVAAYDYTDEAGALLYQVVRLDPKDFRQRRPDSAGKWIWDLKGVRRVLYHLPEVLKNDEVLLCEGEKDADALRELGFTATTNAGGAGKWSDSYTDTLTGKDVVLFEDNDTSGRTHTATVTAALYGRARSLKVIRFTDLPEKGDVADFLATFKDRETAQERLSIMIDGAAPWTPAKDPPKEKPTAPPKSSPIDALLALAVKKEYCDMLGDEKWLFPNLIIRNQVTVIIAKSGGGKSTICYNYVAPYMIEKHDVKVFYLDCDSPASDHKKLFERAEAMGPNFAWINPVTNNEDPEKLIEILKNCADSGERLDDTIFFLDTLKKFIDLLDKKSVKPFFTLMRRLTSQGATVVLLGHANKHRDSNGNLLYEGVGDVQSDADAMILFERMSSPDGGMHVTTVIDYDKGAKVRGLYEPLTFYIERESREVSLCGNVVAVPDWAATKNTRLSEDEIAEKVREYLKGRTGDATQSEIVNALNQSIGVGVVKLRKILRTVAVHESKAELNGQIFYRSGNTFNQMRYSVL